MSWQPSATPRTLRARARIYAEIRAYFASRECLEVDTPLLSPCTNPDPQIASIEADNQGNRLYLQTSPEFAMKRLLAAGSGSIYQICHAFRAGERGRRHRPEFTLLEWYRVGYDYQRLMDEIEDLIDHLSNRRNAYRRVRYAELFDEYLGIDIDSMGIDEFRALCATRIPGTDSRGYGIDDCLDLLLSLEIAPRLEGFVFVTDYPLSQASLARVSGADAAVAERFELYHDGLELANGFSELTDARLQRERFIADNRVREQRDQPRYPLDELMLAALAQGLPECAGVALGLDRLLMVLLGFDSIEQVMTFNDPAC